jgi:hypothetical protein
MPMAHARGTWSGGERTFTLAVAADSSPWRFAKLQKLKDWCLEAMDEKTIRRFLKEV